MKPYTHYTNTYKYIICTHKCSAYTCFILVSQARPNLRAGPYRLEMISARGKWVWYISQVKSVSIENFIEPIRLKELIQLLMT